MDISVERLKQLFEYKDGVLRWKKQQGCAMEGNVAGTRNRNHLYVMVDTVRMRADTIVWMLHTGEMPIGSLRHLDDNPTNCKFDNLLDDLRPVRNANPRMGISYIKSKDVWQVDITFEGKRHRVGTFKERAEADKHYDEGLAVLLSGGVITKRPRRTRTGK